MKTFKQFLLESRSAPLYHATRLFSANKIIRDDILLPGIRVGKYRGKDITKSISFTRSLSTAKSWVSSTEGRIIFEFDQQKLAQKYRIMPVNMYHVWASDKDGPYFNTDPNKHSKVEELFEEMINSPIKNVTKYITKIIYDGSSLHYLHEEAPEVIKHPKLYVRGKFINQ